MVDRRFFHYAGPVALSEILALTGATLLPQAQDVHSLRFEDVAPLDKAGGSDISFLDNTKYLEAFSQSQAGACFVRSKFAARAPAGMHVLITEEPYVAYAKAAQRFYPDAPVQASVSPLASIAASAVLGEGCRVDAGAVISEHARLGARCHIGSGAVIGAHVEMGDDCRIGAVSTLSHAILGARVLIHRGVHIGQDGFGFAPSRTGVVKVPQLGRVLIGDDVEIGSGSCIDRGAGPDTVIGRGTKIDNLVQIGHNVQIGSYVFMAAHTGVAGSAQIGDFSMIGGQVGIAGHIKLGKGVKVIAQSGVMHDLPDGGTYGGSPAISSRDWHRQTVSVAKLAKKA